MNWKAVDERIVHELSLYRFGKVLRDDISFDALCEEMSAYDRFIEQKNRKKQFAERWDDSWLPGK